MVRSVPSTFGPVVAKTPIAKIDIIYGMIIASE